MGFLSKAVSSLTSGALGLGGSLGGLFGMSNDSVLSGIPFIGQGHSAELNRNFQAGQSAQQMAFQEKMATTQHQRQVTDMKKAGLNPILSAMGGGGSTVPTGASGSGSADSGASSSGEFVRDLLSKRREQAEADITNTKAKTMSELQHAQVLKEQKSVARATARQIKADTALKTHAETRAKVYSKGFKEVDKFMDNSRGNIRKLKRKIQSGASSAKRFKQYHFDYKKFPTQYLGD